MEFYAANNYVKDKKKIARNAENGSYGNISIVAAYTSLLPWEKSSPTQNSCK